MQKFQDLLTEAAQLKEHQLKNQRKNFESQPEYLKSGLNYNKKYQVLRNQHFLLQMHISERLKKEGNDQFLLENYNEALSRYEEALSIFRYISAKTYDNMKDEDMIYHMYSLPETQNKFQEDYENHLLALYLNICSCLTKLNKKEDALHSADEALKIKQTAKVHYKKAQSYLQYINKDSNDIKLGFYYLNKSYEISRDSSILQQMHKIKKEIDQERDKQKKWFKFMFDKNKENKQCLQIKSEEQSQNSQKTEKIEQKQKTLKKETEEQKKPSSNLETKRDKPQNQNKKNEELNDYLNEIKNMKQLPQQTKLPQLQTLGKAKANMKQTESNQKEEQRLEKTKEKLSKFVSQTVANDQWLIMYEEQFIARHGSKIYSILQIYGYKEYLGQYKSILAQCLAHPESKQKNSEAFKKYFDWLKAHPVDKISKYLQRYQLQTKWIQTQRQKAADRTKMEAQNPPANKNSYSQQKILSRGSKEQVYEQNQLSEEEVAKVAKKLEMIEENTKSPSQNIQSKRRTLSEKTFWLPAIVVVLLVIFKFIF